MARSNNSSAVSPVLLKSAASNTMPILFFFKQKTAYDVGLGIPAEPLFRSNGHIKFNLTIPLQQLNGLETLVIIMVANKYAFLQITRRRFLNEWEAFKKVISRRNIRRRITIPLTLS